MKLTKGKLILEIKNVLKEEDDNNARVDYIKIPATLDYKRKLRKILRQSNVSFTLLLVGKDVKVGQMYPDVSLTGNHTKEEISKILLNGGLRLFELKTSPKEERSLKEDN